MSDEPVVNGAPEAPLPPEQEKQAEEPKVQLKVESKEEKKAFSWLEPHPIFVIILVGPEEVPFGIQKDLLCDGSEHYRKMFNEVPANERLEHVVRLPDTSKDVFGLAQAFLFTGTVVTEPITVPAYENLVGLWRLGHKLGIHGLCDKTLAAMSECRRLTQRIPATPLLVQVWKDTPEGSAIRTLLLSWAAEYMRSSDARAEFAKSLPQEVLSELVVTMSSSDSTPSLRSSSGPPVAVPLDMPMPKKNVHYLEEGSDEETMNNTKRNRLSGGLPDSMGAFGRKPPRRPLIQPQRRRSSGVNADGRAFTTSQKLNFCADLLARMLSGPGFWTRLVGPFKEPVDPQQDGVPDYFEKVKKPMDLNTVKDKMDRNEYTDDQLFLADVRQIFDNCFMYWKKGDPMWNAGEKLQKTFEDKYAGMNKWISKMEGDEGEPM